MSSLRARLPTMDPLVALVALGSLVVYALHGYDHALTRDLGVYTYGGQRFLAGDPPYVGILNRAGPLAHVLPGIGIGVGRLAGLTDVHAARAFFTLLSVACVCLVYVVVRDLTRSRAAAVVAAVAFLSFQGFIDAATDGPREKTAMVLFLLAALLALVHRRWATCGVFVALGTLTWQPVFFVALVTVLVASVFIPERRPAALMRVLVGGAATTALVMVYYVLEGALHTFLEGFVLINAQYTHQSNALTIPDRIWASLLDGYGASLWVILFGFAAVLVLGIGSVRPAWRTRETTPATYVGLAAATAVGLGWSFIAFNAWPDLFEMLPLAAIGVGGAAAWMVRRLDARTVVAVTAVVAAVGTTYAVVFSVSTRSQDLRAQQASVAAVLARGPHPATLLSVQSPEALVLAHRANPTPYQMFDNGFTAYVDATYPGGIAGYVAWLDRHQPTYVVMQTVMKPHWLLPWLKQHYVQVGSAPQFTWWVNKAAPPRMRAAMEQANAEATAGTVP